MYIVIFISGWQMLNSNLLSLLLVKYIRKVGWWFYSVSTLFELFNTELSHFGLVWFYGISTIVGYLMQDPFLYI